MLKFVFLNAYMLDATSSRSEYHRDLLEVFTPSVDQTLETG